MGPMDGGDRNIFTQSACSLNPGDVHEDEEEEEDDRVERQEREELKDSSNPAGNGSVGF